MLSAPSRAGLAAFAFATAFFAIPLYPALITLTGATVPGVSLLPPAATLALAACALLLGCAFGALAVRGPRRALPTVAPFAALPVAAVVAALLGLDPRAGALFVAIGAAGVLWHAAVLRRFGEPRVATATFAALLVSGAIASAVAVVAVLVREPASLYAYGHGRAVGTFILPGELAGYEIIAVPFAFALARTARERWMRVLAWTAVVLELAAFVLTFSRAGWLGMAAAIATFVLLLRRRNAARYAVAVVGAAAVVLALVFNVRHDPSENFTRISIWQAALGTFARFPLTGVGPFDFARFYPEVRVPGGEPVAFHAHSIVLTIAAETGLVGLAALAFGWGRFVAVLRRALRASPVPDRVAIALAAGLAGSWVQGTIDTVSVVIFGLWMPMTALAIACAERGGGDARTPAPHRRTHPALVALAVIVACGAASMQLASAALYARTAAPDAPAARLSPAFGAAFYTAIQRAVPLPFVARDLARDALRRGDVAAARAHAMRLPPGAERSDLLGRVALADGRTGDAIPLLLDAGDDAALQRIVDGLQTGDGVRAAYALEMRVRDRLAADETRPNALADSWWRLGRLAARLGEVDVAAHDYDRAIALAPYNTKYLIDAGRLARARGDARAAGDYFRRAVTIDPRRAQEVPAPPSPPRMIR